MGHRRVPGGSPTRREALLCDPDPGAPAEWVPKLEPFDMFLPGTPPVTPREELGICYTLSGYELDRKLRGIQEHASQIEGLRKVFGEDGLRRFMAEEYYRLAEVKEG